MASSSIIIFAPNWNSDGSNLEWRAGDTFPDWIPTLTDEIFDATKRLYSTRNPKVSFSSYSSLVAEFPGKWHSRLESPPIPEEILNAIRQIASTTEFGPEVRARLNFFIATSGNKERLEFFVYQSQPATNTNELEILAVRLENTSWLKWAGKRIFTLSSVHYRGHWDN